MAVTAVINIEQFETNSFDGVVRQKDPLVKSDRFLSQIAAGGVGTTVLRFLPAITNPVAAAGKIGWETEDEENWSDSPANQPNLLYRYRFSWGRDYRLAPSQIPLGDQGFRWGNLDFYSGLLLYQEVITLSSSTKVRQFLPKMSASVRQNDFSVETELNSLRQLPSISAEGNVTQFPFLLVAEPEPFSIKNPVDTDVFIRLGNYTNPIASGTINLYLDDVLKQPLQIQEFFGGLGGFNVTWVNNELFNYDATVNVRWEFSDTDIPPNQTIIKYQFKTVKDLAGPRVQNLIPPHDAVDIPINGPIYFDVVDFENGVDISTLILFVNNVRVEDGVNGTLEYIPFINEKGFTIKFTPKDPWLYGDLIPVSMFITDTSNNNNEVFFSYSFTTEESKAPRLLNLRPAACALKEPTSTDIALSIIDGGHGLNKSSIVVTIEEKQKDDIQLVPIIHRDD